MFKNSKKLPLIKILYNFVLIFALIYCFIVIDILKKEKVTNEELINKKFNEYKPIIITEDYVQDSLRKEVKQLIRNSKKMQIKYDDLLEEINNVPNTVSNDTLSRDLSEWRNRANRN